MRYVLWVAKLGRQDMSTELRRLKWRLQINEHILARQGDVQRTDGKWVSQRVLELIREIANLEELSNDPPTTT